MKILLLTLVSLCTFAQKKDSVFSTVKTDTANFVVIPGALLEEMKQIETAIPELQRRYEAIKKDIYLVYEPRLKGYKFLDIKDDKMRFTKTDTIRFVDDGMMRFGKPGTWYKSIPSPKTKKR